MKCLNALSLGCIAVLGVACLSEHEPEREPVRSSLGASVVQDGIVYSPAGIGPQGCVLYRQSIPGGQAAAAMMYRSKDGEFSINRPDGCVRRVGAR